ncbi:MAG: PQQ-dependent sugar dehydrogenase [Pseudomonadota bacterium]
MIPTDRVAKAAALTLASASLLTACTVNTDQVAGDASAPAPRISVAETQVTEGDDGAVDAIFTITLDRASQSTVTVDYTTVDGTAAAGIDFFGRTGMLTFDAGQTTATVSVPVVGDEIREGDENFRLELSNPVGAEFQLAGAIATIVDNDLFPQLQVADASANEASAGVTPLSFLVTLTATPDAPVMVDYSVDPGTATPDEDYLAVMGTLTFSVGVTSQTVVVDLLDDDIEEGPESIVLSFSNVVNGVLPEGPATGTIVDDDDESDGVGLTTRPPNDVCLAGATPTTTTTVGLTDAFPSLPDFAAPIQLLRPPAVEPLDDAMPPPPATVWHMVERGGLIYRYDSAALPDPEALPDDPPAGLSVFVDLTARVDASGEGGLLSAAFHPDFALNGFVFVSYTRTSNGAGPLTSVISRFVSEDGGLTLDPASELELLTVEQPFTNHNGGRIGFGDDGLFYIAMGDGGGAGDPKDNAQDTTNLLGAMLRVDVNFGTPYTIPETNPFADNPTCATGGVGAAPCPEIWAWGLRNPWQWQFDGATGRLWVGDVGQDAVEEIDVVVGGGNYGWRIREGSRCFDPAIGCTDIDLVRPTAEYAHDEGLGSSITGGYVYRGSAIPTLVGRYVFADFVSGRVLALSLADDGGYTVERLLDTTRSPASFFEDAEGELYLTDIASGRFLRMTPNAASENNPWPDALADTGCIDLNDFEAFANAVIPYATLVDSFTEEAVHSKGFALPNNTFVDAGLDPETGNGDWTLPDTYVLLQTLELNGSPVETRVLARHTDGRLRGYTYAWDPLTRTATRVRGGAIINLGESEGLAGPLWYYPSENECLDCHLGPAGGSLGLESPQLNSLFTYGPRRANQLTTLEGIDLFTEPLPAPATDLPAFPRLDDMEETLTRRARAYLHVNCSSCHRPGGSAPGALDLRFEQTVDMIGACDVAPVRGDLAVEDPRLIASGDAARSILRQRMAERGPRQMPPSGQRIADAAGIALVDAWISAMGPDCLVPDEDDVGIIIVPPPEDEPPPDDDALSIAAFQATVWPLVRGEAMCSNCHFVGGPASPAFADPVVETAHAQTLDNMLVNLEVAAASRLVERLAVDNHQCWSADCNADATQMQAAIQAWADLLADPPPDPDPDE